MRSYLIDELTRDDLERLVQTLKFKEFESPLDGVFYLPVPPELLTTEQGAHEKECGPFVLVLETGEDFLRLELLVRGRGKLRCSCIAYAGRELRDKAVSVVDQLLADCGLPV